MSFHISNFGAFSESLRKFADLTGYVPEEGDRPEDFNWTHDEFEVDFDSQGNGYYGYAAEQWRIHVAEAKQATREAEAALEEWRQQLV